MSFELDLNGVTQRLAIAPDSFMDYVRTEAMLTLKLADLSQEAMAIHAALEDDKEPSRLLQMTDEGVGVISIKGMLVNENSYYNRYFGVVAYDEIREAVIEALDEGATAIYSLIDSPGGNVNGLDDLANFMSSVDVPTMSYTTSRMLSAAYFYGSQADHVLAGGFADVGSIGVVVKRYDRSKMLANMGIKPERFRTGELKASGDPDFPLSAKEKKNIQAQVELFGEKFFDVVSDARGMPREVLEKLDITSGKTFIGEEALGVNLVDGICTFDESMQKVYNLAKVVDKPGNKSLFSS